MSKKTSKGLTMAQFKNEVRGRYQACARWEVKRRNMEDDPFQEDDGTERPWTLEDLEEENWPEDTYEQVLNRLDNATDPEGNEGQAAACLLLLTTWASARSPCVKNRRRTTGASLGSQRVVGSGALETCLWFTRSEGADQSTRRSGER